MSDYLPLAIAALLVWAGIVVLYACYGPRARPARAKDAENATPPEPPVVPSAKRVLPSPEEVRRDLARRRAVRADLSEG